MKRSRKRSLNDLERITQTFIKKKFGVERDQIKVQGVMPYLRPKWSAFVVNGHFEDKKATTGFCVIVNIEGEVSGWTTSKETVAALVGLRNW